MKKFILILSILALMLGLFATEVVIGTGTATQRFPLGSFYGHERSAALYTAAEIGAQNTRILRYPGIPALLPQQKYLPKYI